MCTTGINDTGGKFTTGINGTGGMANISTIFASVVDTGGKFATGVNENFKKKNQKQKISWHCPFRKFS